MLTHTIRAFFLVGLIVIAHASKPFSLGNVTAFTRATFHSFSFALPEQAVNRLERAGELVALLGSGWGDIGSSTGRLADKLAALKSDFSAAGANERVLHKAKTVNQQLTPHRFEKIWRSLQARNRTSLGAAPLPLIPGIEASLIPNATLLMLPSFATAAGAALQDAQGFLPGQPKWLDLDCEWRSAFEKPTRMPEDALLKLQEVQFPAPNIKVRVLNQRASNGQACPQPGKATGARSGNAKQSC